MFLNETAAEILFFKYICMIQFNNHNSRRHSQLGLTSYLFTDSGGTTRTCQINTRWLASTQLWAVAEEIMAEAFVQCPLA